MSNFSTIHRVVYQWAREQAFFPFSAYQPYEMSDPMWRNIEFPLLKQLTVVTIAAELRCE